MRTMVKSPISIPEKDSESFTSEEMYKILREDILSLKLLPGSLVSENQISEQFHLSRTPIRGVFAHLAKDNLLLVRPKSGTYVSLINLERAFQSLYIRVVVETNVFESIARHGNMLLMHQLEENLALEKQAIENGIYPEDWYKLDSKFHELCMSAAHRENVWHLIQELNTDYVRYRRLDYLASNKTDNSAFRSLYEEHFSLYTLMKSRDVPAIRYAVANHLYSGLLRRLNNFQNKFSSYISYGSLDIDSMLLDIKIQLADAKPVANSH